MGLSHVSIVHAHPDVDARRGVVDSNTYVLDVLTKYSGLPTFNDFDAMLDEVEARRRRHRHAHQVPRRDGAGRARARPARVLREAAVPDVGGVRRARRARGRRRGLVTQVGYHNRFVGAFAEVKRLLDAGAIGRGHPRPRRGLRPGRAATQGCDVAQPAVGGRRLPLRLRRAPARSPPLVLRRRRSVSAAPCSARCSRVTPRTRCSPPCTTRRFHGAAVRELVGRVATEDDDEAHPLGHDRSHLRRPPGVPGVPA